MKVWQKGNDLAVYLYKLTMKGAFFKDYGLRDQIRRAAVSIPSNISEGDELVAYFLKPCHKKQEVH